MRESLEKIDEPEFFELTGIKNLNILILGIIGAGKSQSINTFASIFKGEYT